MNRLIQFVLLQLSTNFIYVFRLIGNVDLHTAQVEKYTELWQKSENLRLITRFSKFAFFLLPVKCLSISLLLIEFPKLFLRMPRNNDIHRLPQTYLMYLNELT